MNPIRTFYPGSEWIYLKLYAGVKTADVILLEAIKPLLRELKTEGLVKKWFFIRYHDPRPHLRIRFHASSDNNLILEKFNKAIQEYVESGEISNVAWDTYKREIERYGENTIELAEELFCNSSDLILNFLEYDDEEKIILVLYYIDCIFSELKLTLEEKLEWVENFNNAFKLEFNANKNLNNQLKQKYKEFIPEYLFFIDNHNYADIRKLIEETTSDISSVIQNIIELSKKDSQPFLLVDFFQSIFHMHINRTFISEQRLFEMVVYDYFFRFFKI